MNLLIFFVAGLIIGSFLNVIILRLDDLKSILLGRSQCRSCKTTLAWYELIPLLSFVLLKGKCRYCQSQISWQYPAVELFTGFLFMFLYFTYGLTANLFFYLFVFSILIIVAVYDLMTQYVPEFFVWVSLMLSLLAGWFFGGFPLTNGLLGALVAGGIVFLFVFLSKEKWMGSGDIKIALILGALLGFPGSILGLFGAFVLGSVAGLIYIYYSKKGLKTALPFAPFLILSTLITLIYGNTIINWYLGKLTF